MTWAFLPLFRLSGHQACSIVFVRMSLERWNSLGWGARQEPRQKHQQQQHPMQTHLPGVAGP